MTDVAEVPRREWLAPLALGIVVALVYALGLRNGFGYDDHELILSRPAIQGIGGLLDVFRQPHYTGLAYYRPLTRLTLEVQKAVFGEQAWPFHLFNMIAAGGLAVAALGALRGLLPHAKEGAFAAALVYAIHPVTSACVYPITGREALLATTFSLAAVAALPAFLRGRRWPLAVAVTLAMFSRESSVVLLPLLLGATWLVDADATRLKRGRTELICVCGAVLIVFIGLRSLALASVTQRPHLQSDWMLVPLSYLYALRGVFTPDISLVYEPAFEDWFSLPRVVVAGTVACAVLAMVHRRSERIALFVMMWFVMALAPSANVFVQESPFAERHLLFPMFGACLMLASLLSTVPRRVVSVVLAIVFGVISIWRAHFHRDDLTFYGRWVETSPGSAIVWANYGFALMEADRNGEARQAYERALKISETQPRALANLGYLDLRENRPAEAKAHFEAALKADPSSAAAANGLGKILWDEGKADEAKAIFESILAVNPNELDAMGNLAQILLAQRDALSAEPYFRRAVAIRPGDAGMQRGLGACLLQLGDAKGALLHLLVAQQGSESSPQFFNELGTAYAMLGNRRGAREAWQRALELDANQPDAKRNLAQLDAMEGTRR